MDPIARFMEYAAAFEEVYESDDWSALEAFFTEDAVYEVVGATLLAGRHEGRAAVFAALKAALDAHDRRFPTRELVLREGPELSEGVVKFRWQASYRGPGIPELVMEGRESIWLEGDRITRLVDEIPLEIGEITAQWFSHYGELLGP